MNWAAARVTGSSKLALTVDASATSVAATAGDRPVSVGGVTSALAGGWKIASTQ